MIGITFMRKSDLKKIGYLVLTILIMLSFGSCSFPKKETSAAPADRMTNSEYVALTEIKGGRPDIYLIVKIIESSYWQVIIQGAQDAGEELGCNIYMGGTANETDWPGQKVLIEQAIERGADGIILSPDDSVELAGDIDRIHKQHIPIVLIDTAANTDSFDICYMTDNLLAGQNAAAEMLFQLNEMGHSTYEDLTVGILVGQATSQTINERLAGFIQYWSFNAPDSWEIITDIKNCNGNIDLGEELITDLMKEHPNLAGLYGTNNGPTKALAQTISGQGRKDIVVVGFDMSDEIRALIESPDYHASTMLQRQYDMSYRGVEAILDMLNDEFPKIKFEDTGVASVNHNTMNDPDIIEVLSHN